MNACDFVVYLWKLVSVLFKDNHWVIDLLKNPKFHDCTKHTEWVQNSDIWALHCLSNQLVADIMTKAFLGVVFERMQ